MNLPNKLTILRVILIPFFVFFLISPFFDGYGNYIALAIFIIASLTDMADGKIARKYNLVTNFGKFMDPLADKLLVCSAMICLVDLKLIPVWVVLIIIAREFIISGFRLVASDMESSLQQATGESLRQPSRCLWLLLLFLISICSLAG